MSKKIAEYLLHVAINPDERRKHEQADSKGAAELMRTYGLNDQQIQTVLSQNPQQIAQAIQAEFPEDPKFLKFDVESAGFCVTNQPGP